MRPALLALLTLACAEPRSCPPADLAPIAGEPAYAFVGGDYASSVIGVLDADGNVLREAWIDSGTVTPTLVPAVSGDTVLGGPLAPCVVTVIDREAAVLTFLDACAEEEVVLGQLDVGPTFNANPQDAIAIDETRALVSRSQPNLQPGAAELERGNDLLVVDWREGRVLSRVDLSPLDHVGDERMYARPERLALLERGEARVVIAGLARLTSDFMRAGPGVVAVVDLATLEPRALALDGLTNCREVDAVPGAPERAIVTCNGPSFGGALDRQAGAGVAALELMDSGEVRVGAFWRASDHPEAPVFNTWTVPLGAERVVSVAMGEVGRSLPDQAGVLALGGEARALMEAGDAFVLGDGAFDPQSQILFLPDAAEGTLRRFDLSTGAAHELDPVGVAACRGLPPRELRRIAP